MNEWTGDKSTGIWKRKKKYLRMKMEELKNKKVGEECLNKKVEQEYRNKKNKFRIENDC